MLLPVIQSVDDVVERQLCCGCGACAAACPTRYRMTDTLDHGRRPVRRDGTTRSEPDADDEAALAVCPGTGLEHGFDPDDPALIKSLQAGWGPVMEVWEGHAADDEIRFEGSSGGACTALSLACLDDLGMHGVLHIRARRGAPYLNETVLSTSLDDLMQATGSRYAPASPCEGLGLIERAPGPCVFIGKPCDVAATRLVAEQRPTVARKLGVTIAFFCAGTPTTRATTRLLERLGLDDLTAVRSLRYRGHGWPGRATATARDGDRTVARSMSYEESWGDILTHDKQWRCHVCADHTGEMADIAVGDPWHTPPAGDEPGRSLILVRTRRGAVVLRRAIRSGHLVARRVDPETLPAAQPNLLRGRGAVWGRSLACRMLGVAAPRYVGFPMFRFWWSELSPGERLRTLLGTTRRVFTRGLRRRVTVKPLNVPQTPTVERLAA